MSCQAQCVAGTRRIRESWIPNREALSKRPGHPNKYQILLRCLRKLGLTVKKGGSGIDHRVRFKRAVSKCQQSFTNLLYFNVDRVRWLPVRINKSCEHTIDAFLGIPDTTHAVRFRISAPYYSILIQ